MKYCRYDKDAEVECCPGCEKGCLDKQPAAYINLDFEEAVKEMEKNDFSMHCVDGSCPMALSEEYEERGMDVVHSCDECLYHN